LSVGYWILTAPFSYVSPWLKDPVTTRHSQLIQGLNFGTFCTASAKFTSARVSKTNTLTRLQQKVIWNDGSSTSL